MLLSGTASDKTIVHNMCNSICYKKNHVILATSDNLQKKNNIQHSFILNNVIDIVFKHAENTILYLPQCATTHSLFVNNYEHTNCLARVLEELATKTIPYRVCDKL